MGRNTELQKLFKQGLKRCSKCKKVKIIAEFTIDNNSKSGLYCKCKECQKEYREIPKVKNRQKKYLKSLKWKKHQILYREGTKFKSIQKKYHERNIYKLWALSSIQSHSRKGCKIQITINELKEISQKAKSCAICKTELKWRYGEGNVTNSPTLDRVNNGNIINKDNIQILCRRCNSTKHDRTMSEFIEYCKTVVEKFGKTLFPV